MRLHIKALMMVLSESEDDITVFTQYIPKIVALVLDYTSRKIQLDQWRNDQEENGKNKVERPSLTINMDYIPFGVTLKYLYDHNAIADANMFFVDTKGGGSRKLSTLQVCLSNEPFPMLLQKHGASYPVWFLHRGSCIAVCQGGEIQPGVHCSPIRNPWRVYSSVCQERFQVYTQAQTRGQGRRRTSFSSAF
jgi:hypothetical protein